MEANNIIRHIQLKASCVGSKTASQKINIKLAGKPSSCVIWIYFKDDTLELRPFYFFGNLSGQPLPSLDNKRIAKHTKGDSDGHKAERSNIRVLNRGDFSKYETIQDIYRVLFGDENV